jgi:membrane protein YdbS with pleckstrin-like domain
MSKNSSPIRAAASVLMAIIYAVALILPNSMMFYIIAVMQYDIATKASSFIITVVYNAFMVWFITDYYYHTNYYVKLYTIKDNIIMARLELTEAEINIESGRASSSIDPLMDAVYKHIKTAKKLLDVI